MTSSAKIAGGDIQLSVDRANASHQLQELRSEVRTVFAGMSDDTLKFIQAQDRLDRALKQSNGKITQSVRSAELNLRRVEQEALKSANAVTAGASRSSSALEREERSLNRVARGALSASGAFGKLRTGLVLGSTSFLGGYGATYLLKQFVDEASNVQEETEKTGVVFGENAHQVQAWSRTLAQSFGVGEGAALKATGVFGNMLRPLGFGTDAAAKMSERLVELAADMASFNNAKPDEVLQALSSGLAGQVRPLRQYGVFLSQTRIEEEALADGIAKRGEKLTQAQKVQAAYNIILKDTKNAQGDVARNTESLSVAQSKFHAGLEDLEAGIARDYLPQLTSAVNHGAKWLNQSKNQERVQRDVAAAVNTAEAAVHGIVDVFKLVAPPVRLANKALGGTESTVKLLAIAFLGLKLRGLAADFGLLRTRTAAAGASALVAAGEYNTLAAAEQRAAAAGAGVGAGAGLPRGIPNVGTKTGVVARVNQYTGVGAAAAGAAGAAGLGLGVLGSIALGGFGAQSDLIKVPLLYIDEESHGAYLGKRVAPGSTTKINGEPYLVTVKDGNYHLYSRAWLTAHQPGKPRGRFDSGHGTKSGPVLNPPAAPTPAQTPPPPIDRATRIQLQLQRARLAVARGDKGAEAELVSALQAEVALDRDNERLQQRLATTDVKNRKAHLAELQQLYSDEESALNEIASLEAAHEQAKTTIVKKRANARKKAERDRDALIARLYRGHTAFATPGRYPGESDAEYALRSRSEAMNKLFAAKIRDAKDATATKTQAAAAAAGGGAAANQAQFLSSFKELIGPYFPNAFPVAKPSSGKTDTHLFNVVHELREQTPVLRKLAGRSAFPASGYLVASAEAATG